MHTRWWSATLAPLRDALWTGAGFGRRSRDLSPLYIKRFHGPRLSRKMTRHGHWEFTCVLGGAGQVLAAPPLPLLPHTVCLVPPGFRHGEYSAEGMDTIWIGLAGARLNALPRNALPHVQSRQLCEAAERLWFLAEHGQGPIGPELDGLALAFAGLFVRLARGGAADTPHDVLDRAIRFLNERFAEPLPIPETARRFGYSEGYFQRLFRRRTGLTPVAYLTRLRCRHAAHLLEETDWPVARIAELSGYPDALYFSRVFRRQIGCCPRAFRERAPAPPALRG